MGQIISLYYVILLLYMFVNEVKGNHNSINVSKYFK